MKLLINTELVESHKHDWRKASDNFAHMNGVSWLGRCNKCGVEAITGSVERYSKCSYYKNEYLYSWDGEDSVYVTPEQKRKNIDKVKKHMLRIAKRAKIELDCREFQSTTIVAADAYRELINENRILITDNYKVKFLK